MKAIDILNCLIEMGVDMKNISTIDVPDYGQIEEWWLEQVGGLPPQPIKSGRYLYYYESVISTYLYDKESPWIPSEEIEVGDDYIFLYKIEE